MSPLQFFARVCGLILTLILIPLALYGCGSSTIPGGGDSSEVNNDYTTITCNQNITVQLTQEQFDAQVEAGEVLTPLSVDETPAGTVTITASQCVDVGDDTIEEG
jgi:hypothetical protein